MALKLINKDSLPAYLALSSDINENATITGASYIGKTIYLTDLQETRIILPNLKLIPFSYSNGTSGVEPEFSSAEVGTVDEFTVVVTFNENIVASNYSGGVTIKKNGVIQVIDSSTRQSNHAVVYYILHEAVEENDIVTWEYNQNNGGIVSQTGTVYLDNVSAQTVTNNVVAP